MNPLRLSATLVVLTLLASCTRAGRTTHEPALVRSQVIGSHNSYKLGVQPELLDVMNAAGRRGDGIDYSHLSLVDQLNLGLRSLELDVCHDPDGGRYADPLGHRLLRLAGIEPWPLPDPAAMSTPGFKLLHEPDFDFRSAPTRLEEALAMLKAWSRGRDGHAAIVVTMNCKQGSTGLPGSTPAPAFETQTLRELDRLILATLGRDRLVVPDDVRGSASTLREAVLAGGWSRADSRGRFIFVLDEGSAVRERYLAAFADLRGATFFTTASPPDDLAAFLVINDPVKSEVSIRERVREGYLVRTRADADTREARTNDRRRFEAAMRSGAHVISTDYYVPDRRRDERFVIRFEGGGFTRPNPVTGR
jgi:hypothetical protein